MTEITHWADVIAETVLKNNDTNKIATGITPSGHIHIGNIREVVTADSVFRAIKDKGQDSEFIYISDDFDPLRKVYPFLSEDYAEHVGKPLSEIPCPCNECESYSEHFLKPFIDSLKILGIKPKLIRANELYKSGAYVELIKTALLKRDELACIIEEISHKKLTDDWSPFNPLCNACGKINDATVIGFNIDAESVDYSCNCGNKGVASMRGGGKLTWRVDWASRWSMLGITVEPFGKDHASRGGSYDTGIRISKEIYKYPPPNPIVYEWIMLGKKGAMSSSSGVVISVFDILKVLPPAVLRYLIIRTKPEKHIKFDPALPLLNLVDEYERIQANPKTEHEKRIIELSYAFKNTHTNISFKHMVTVCQIAQNNNHLLEILKRTGHCVKKKQDIFKLAENVRNWLDLYAPPMVKFSIKKDLPMQSATLSDLQRAFLKSLSIVLSDTTILSGEDYHNLIYSAKDSTSLIYNEMKSIFGDSIQEYDINPKEMFHGIYMTLLGEKSGPKAGWLLASIDKEFLINRFNAAAEYKP